jgi:hypothetical protein
MRGGGAVGLRMPTLQDITIPLTIQIDTDALATELIRVERAMVMPAILSILASRAVWGWGSFYGDNHLAGLHTDPGDRGDFGPARRVPTLVIRAVREPFVIQLSEQELADLGPCPNL